NNVGSQDVLFGVRPDHMYLGNEGIEAVVDVEELMGTSSHLHTQIDGEDVIAIIPNEGNSEDYSGKTIKLAYNGNTIHLFSKEDEHNLEY
ncbi:MAG: TOBE domain-containing protein, partial [Firmicutes bacterium]|nr:TOBE domain-containing protein [Bacillota bacterium]